MLYWAKESATLEHATHIVNSVWVGTEEDNPDEDPVYHRDAWLDRGVVPLDWAGGRVYSDRGVDELVRGWSGSIGNGHVGIAIDEFGSLDREENETLAAALLQLRERHPSAVIAVWHAGLITRAVADAYRQAADLVLLESYVSGSSALGLKFAPYLWSARRFNLEAKTLPSIALGHERYAETLEDASAQLDWLARRADDFAGVAIYGSKADPDLAREFDRYLGRTLY